MDYVWEIEDDVLFLETYFAITRGGRYTLGGGRAVEHFMESFMPFYHPDVYREYTAISYPPRKHRKLELKLLKKVFPDTEVIKRTRKPWYYSIPFAKYAYRLLKPLANRANIRLTPKIAQYYIGDWIAGETRLNTMIRDLLATNSILEQVFPGEEVNKKVMKELLSSGSRYSFYNTFIDFEIYVRQLFQNLGVDEIKILDTDGSAFATITKPEGKQNN